MCLLMNIIGWDFWKIVMAIIGIKKELKKKLTYS